MERVGEAEAIGTSTPARGGAAEPGDRALLRAVRAGSGDAAETLVRRHWPRAHRIAYGILGDEHAAEDVAQEAMLAALAKIGRFDPYRPFAPWLHRIVANRALDQLRSRRRRGEVVSGAPEASFAAGRGGGVGADDAGLGGALAGLSPEHRAVVVLRYVGGYGPGEIARLLGVPRGTVGSRLRRALDQLRTKLEDEDG